MSAVTLEALAEAERFDCQIALVRVYWASVQHLWLGNSEGPDGGTFRSDLPDDFMPGCGMPGIASIKFTHNGLFEFAEDGLTTIIIAAYDTIPGNLDANPERHVDHLVDLIAVDLDQPDRFWRRRGEALVLGAAYLDIAGQDGEPVPVFRTPMSWLLSGGAGIAILDWSWVPDLLVPSSSSRDQGRNPVCHEQP